MRTDKDRGLEELALTLALDLEPIDPPDNLEDKILAKITAAEKAPTKEISFSKLWRNRTFRLALWTTTASVSCVALAALYWATLHENERLKEEVRRIEMTSSINNIDEISQSLGNIEKVMPLHGKEGAKGKAFVIRDTAAPSSKNKKTKRMVVISEGIEKKNNNEVIQVWVKDSPEEDFHSVGIIEPKNKIVTFTAEVRKDVSGIMITLENGYQKSPRGKVLLASTPPPYPDTELRKDNDRDNKEENNAKSSSENKEATPVTEPRQETGNDSKPTGGSSSGTQENPTNNNPVEPNPDSSNKPNPPESEVTSPDGGASPQHQSDTAPEQ